MNKTLLKGNIALCEGAIAAGLKAYFGYPITPQNEIPAHMSKRMVELDKVFVQAESELAAINMVLGASATGVRAMTSSSSPGISLKQEGISYMVGCELPALIVNVQRGGPGLGNIAGSQADYFQAVKGGGHGDYHMLVLAPSSAQEMYDFGYLSFDLAEKYRNPVMILSDGVVGQMMEPVLLDKKQIERKTAFDWALTGAKGRPARAIHSLLMAEGALEKHNWHLKEKFDLITKNEIRFEQENCEDADLVIIAFGITARVAKSTMKNARIAGMKVGYFRPITLWPFPSKQIEALAANGKKLLVAEMNMGQMVEDVRLAANGKVPVSFYGRPGGGVVTDIEMMERVKEALHK